MDAKPSNNADLLAISLEKVKHLLRKPGEKSKTEQPMNGNELIVNEETMAKKLRYKLPTIYQVKIEHGEESVSMEPNEKDLMVGSSVEAMNDNSSNKKELLEMSLQKVKHLLRKPGETSGSKQQMDEDIILVNGEPVKKKVQDILYSQGKIFQAKYNIRVGKNVDINPHDQTVRINLNVLQALLCAFGKDIDTLTLRRSSFDGTFNDFQSMSRILNFIQDYCHLKGITLIGFGMCGLNEEFFSRLKSLTLDHCSVTRDWRNMKQLKTLELNQVIFRRWPQSDAYEYGMPRKPYQIPFDRFGALEKVQLTDVNVPNDAVVKLIKLNRKIKSLSIVKCFEISPFILDAVRSMLGNLEEFEYKTQKFRLSSFLRLTSLKKLKVLKLFHQNIDTPKLVNGFVENGVALEHLELGLSRFADETAVSIAKMRSLKILKLNEMIGLNEAHITSMATQLEGLEELQVKMNATISQNGMKDIVREAKRLVCLKVDALGFVLDVDTYQAMLTTIQERAVHNRLELTIYGNGNQMAVPNGILNEQNEEWLTVKGLNRENHHLFEDLTSKVGPPPPQYYNYPSSDDSDSDDYY